MSPQAAPEFRETNRIFEDEVIAKGNFDALDRVYTRDARVMPPGAEMVRGREQAKTFWQQAVAALGVTAIALRIVELELHGDTAVEIGRAEIKTGSGAIDVKYVVVWKQEDGAWKWHIDIWNPVS
jgi:ketosteroid isomerase-like protein